MTDRIIAIQLKDIGAWKRHAAGLVAEAIGHCDKIIVYDREMHGQVAQILDNYRRSGAQGLPELVLAQPVSERRLTQEQVELWSLIQADLSLLQIDLANSDLKNAQEVRARLERRIRDLIG